MLPPPALTSARSMEGHPEDVSAALQEPVPDAHPAPDLVLGCKQHLAVLDHGGLRRRAAHVEGEDIVDAQSLAEVVGAHDARGGPGLYAVDRFVDRRLHRRKAAVGLHHRQRHSDAGPLELVAELAQVLGDYRPDVCVNYRGARPLVLPHLRQKLARYRQRDIRQAFPDCLDDPLLVASIGVRVEQ